MPLSLTLATVNADKSRGPHPLFIADGDPSRLFAQTLPWLILLLVVVIVGGVIIYVARRYMNAGSSSAGAGFTLQDLRNLHAAGEIDDEEFARAKAQMIGRMTAAKTADSDSPGASPPGNQPAPDT
jgi:hypothetical protein